VFGRVILVKALGLTCARGALDATLVRVLLVPATMRLFGDLNWRRPRFLLGGQRPRRSKGAARSSAAVATTT
jgi:RND superfamily putative drug exporter